MGPAAASEAEAVNINVLKERIGRLDVLVGRDEGGGGRKKRAEKSKRFEDGELVDESRWRLGSICRSLKRVNKIRY